MKYRVIHPFTDKHTEEEYVIGETIELKDKKRISELLSKNNYAGVPLIEMDTKKEEEKANE